MIPPYTMHVRIMVKTNAARERMVKGKTLTLYVKEPPHDNLANRRVVQLVAKHFGVASSGVRLVAGHRKPGKTLSIQL